MYAAIASGSHYLGQTQILRYTVPMARGLLRHWSTTVLGPLGRVPRWLVWSCVLLAAGGLVLLVIWVLPLVLTRHPHVASEIDRYRAINDTRTGLVAAIVAIGAAGGLGYTARTYRLSQQGQFIDRYPKAIEQLGDRESLEIRLGGIYALERLMSDSSRDQPTVMEVLAAFIREHAHASSHSNPDAASDQARQDATQTASEQQLRPATDVRAALTGLGRRKRAGHGHPIDLQGAGLQGANLQGANLQFALLVDVNLRGARLREASLEDANLIDANLVGADLTRANLAGVRLQGASLQGANLQGANLWLASLEGTNLEGAGRVLGDC